MDETRGMQREAWSGEDLATFGSYENGGWTTRDRALKLNAVPSIGMEYRPFSRI